MHPVVIVHGAFGGGWEWSDVADRLRAAGVRVRTPTLAGLGDRSGEDASTIDLSAHVEDVVHAVEDEDLREVVLVAASYGGMPVTVAAGRLASRLVRLVYLDALVPREGESAVDLLPPWFADGIRAGLVEDGPAHRVPVPDVVLPPVGSAPEAVRQAYVAHLASQPVLTFLEPARVTATNVPVTFVRSTASDLAAHGDPIEAMARRARAEGWVYREIAASHDPHLSNPDAVVDLLREMSLRPGADAPGAAPGPPA
jgi:pimeloyl-ACP methyl ester carboxylesterase